MEIIIKPSLPHDVLSSVIDRFLVIHEDRYEKARQKIASALQEKYLTEFKLEIQRFASQWGFCGKWDGGNVAMKETIKDKLFLITLSFDATKGMILNALYDGLGNWSLWPQAAQDKWSLLVVKANDTVPDYGKILNTETVEECIREAGYWLPFELLEGVETFPDLDADVVKGILVNKGFHSANQEHGVRFIHDSDGHGGEIVLEVCHLDCEGQRYIVKSISPDKVSLSDASYIVSLLRQFEHV